MIWHNIWQWPVVVTAEAKRAVLESERTQQLRRGEDPMHRRLNQLRFFSGVMTFSLSLAAGCTSDGGTDDGPGPNEELTLDNCATSVASDAPEFYQYFRCVTLTVGSDSISIASVALPPHKSYYYGEDSPNYTAFDGAPGNSPNPGHIEAGHVNIKIPNNPVSRGLTIDESLVDGMAQTSQYEYPGGVGLALDGIPIFDGTAAPGDDLNQASKAFDSYNGHPDFDNLYHYHGDSKGPLEVLARAGLIDGTTPGSAEVEIYGIMCDGTVVLGCTEADGSAPDTSDVDAQGGHVHDIVGESGTTFFSNRYHTHVCASIHTFAPEIQYYDACYRG